MTPQEFIAYCKGLPSLPVGKNVDDRITTLLLTSGTDYITQRELRRLKECLLDKQYIEGDINCVVPIRILRFVLGTIGGGKDKHLNPLGHQNWEEAIGLIKKRLEDGDNRFASIIVDDDEAKELKYAKAIKHLMKYGLEYEFTEGGILFKGSDQKIYGHINQEVKRIGGIRFLNKVFAGIEYDRDLQRFVLPKQGNTLKPTDKEVEYPYNFMLNIGLRHLKHDGDSRVTEEEILEVISLSRDICFVCYPVLEWSIWGYIFHPNKDAIEYMRDLIYLKSVYGLDQASPRYVADFIRFSIDYIKARPDVFGFQLDFSLDEYMSVMEAVMGMSEADRIKVIDVYQIRPRIGRKAFVSIMSHICQRVSKVNDGYYSPMDYEKVSYWPAPVFVDKNKVVLMPTSVSAWGWVEALMAAIRQVDGSVDKEMGTIIEKYISHKFSMKGISCIGGEYQKPKTGECDHVVVTQDRVIFIEDKKKPLTRAAYSGVFKNILSDLAQSLVASQQQCFQHQEDLIKEGQLVMTDKGTGAVETLDNKIQTFESISLSLPDYGPIQARVVLNQVLDLVYRSDFQADTANVKDPEELKDIQARVSDLAKKQKKLRASIDFMMQYKQDKHYKPFFDSWFMSLEQLTFVIEHSDSNDRFYEVLKKIKYCTAGTLDFFNEWRVFCR